MEVVKMEQKKKLLYKAISLIRARIELEPLKYLEFLPSSNFDFDPQAVLLMDKAMFGVLKNFLISGVTVLVVPTGKETVSLEEVEIHNL
jgi:hypothetical protein